MTDVELRKLKRSDLLEILVEQGKENEELKARVDELEKKLADREIRINNAGTIAQAAFEMNGVFEAAQAAAQQYLDNIKLLSERQENICNQKEEATVEECAALKRAVQERCRLMKEEAKKECDMLREKTEQECTEREKAAQERCDALNKQAEEAVEKKWNEISTMLEQFYSAHEGLRDLLTASGIGR